MITEASVCHDPAKPRWTHSSTAAQPLTTAITKHHYVRSLQSAMPVQAKRPPIMNVERL
jgi:hypothetical protein